MKILRSQGVFRSASLSLTLSFASLCMIFQTPSIANERLAQKIYQTMESPLRGVYEFELENMTTVHETEIALTISPHDVGELLEDSFGVNKTGSDLAKQIVYQRLVDSIQCIIDEDPDTTFKMFKECRKSRRSASAEMIQYMIVAKKLRTEAKTARWNECVKGSVIYELMEKYPPYKFLVGDNIVAYESKKIWRCLEN